MKEELKTLGKQLHEPAKNIAKAGAVADLFAGAAIAGAVGSVYAQPPSQNSISH